MAVTLTAVALYSGYTIAQIHGLQKRQTESIDRNRTDSLLLLRIQNNLNALALAMRDMLDADEPYPLTAWKPQFQRLHADLDDAIAREAKFSPTTRTADQVRYLAGSAAQFWDALDRVFALAQSGMEAEARTRIRLSLQARQSALSSAVSRLLVQNNESEERATLETQRIYAGVERNVYLFLGSMLLVIAATGAYLVHYNRRVFEQVADLSERRSELARQLIDVQETTLRHISRELHDDFGQVLTAIGAMLQRGSTANLREVIEIVQSTLEKVRSLSQALHPVVLDEAGLESAFASYLPAFEKRTGIVVDYRRIGASRPVDRHIGIHLYRILQEALNNVARHSQSERAVVRLNFSADSIELTIEDSGVGINVGMKDSARGTGMGLVNMRERAEMVGGRIEFLRGQNGGTLVRLTVPAAAEAHAGA